MKTKIMTAVILAGLLGAVSAQNSSGAPPSPGDNRPIPVSAATHDRMMTALQQYRAGALPIQWNTSMPAGSQFTVELLTEAQYPDDYQLSRKDTFVLYKDASASHRETHQ